MDNLRRKGQDERVAQNEYFVSDRIAQAMQEVKRTTNEYKLANLLRMKN